MNADLAFPLAMLAATMCCMVGIDMTRNRITRTILCYGAAGCLVLALGAMAAAGV